MALGVGSARQRVLVVHGLWTSITTMKRRAANAMSTSEGMSQQQRKYQQETLALAVPLWIALLIIKKGWHALTFKLEKSKNLFLTSLAEVLAEGSQARPVLDDRSASTLPPMPPAVPNSPPRALAREDTIVLDSQPDDLNGFETRPLSPVYQPPTSEVQDLVSTDDEDSQGSQPIPTPPSRIKATRKRPHLELDLTVNVGSDDEDDEILPVVTLHSPSAKRNKPPVNLTREASINILWDCLVCDQSNDDSALQCSRCTLART